MNLSISKKLAIYISTTILALGSIATLVVYQNTNKELFASKSEKIQIVAEEQALRTRETLHFSRDTTDFLSSQGYLTAYLKGTPVAQESDILDRFKQQNIGNHFSAIYLISLDGEVLVSTDDTFVGKNYSFRDYFKQAKNGNSAFDLAIGVTSGELGYYFSSPVKNEVGDTLGVVVLKMRPEIVNESIDISRLESHVMLVDDTGVVVFSDREDRIYRSLSEQTDMQKKTLKESNRYEGKDIQPLDYTEAQHAITTKQKSGIDEIIDEEDDEKEIVAFSQVGDYPLYVILEENTDDITSSVAKLSASIGFFVLLAAVMATTIIIFIVTRSLKPLRQLSAIFLKVAEGDFSKKADIVRSDEIGDMAKSFNIMSDRLTNYQNNLKEMIAEKTAELAKFKLAVEGASDHIIITDKDGTILYANAAVEKITGFSSSEIIGKKAGNRELWGGLMDDEVYKNLWNTIKTKEKTWKGILKNKRKSGEEYDAEAAITPILNDKGELVFFLGMERDITKELEIDRAKDEFVSLASHQLRTPATGVKQFIGMILEGYAGELTKEQRELVQDAYDSNEREIEVIQDLLNVARADAGNLDLDKTEVDLWGLVESIVKEQQAIFVESEQTLVYKKPKKKIIASIDEKKIKMVVDNFINNAHKYTPEKGKICVSVSENAKDIELVVKDNGIGISKKDQVGLFKKFHRIENKKTKDIEGTGLGLYMAKKIIDLHGGKIEIESEVDKGTKFTIIIPKKGK